MSSRLRDTHSYETQIIDAVRSVNKALGGTYGTSSAIHKSEFNQYEVQLIDAIRGIGRTLSGNGLSLAGGDGASLAELQDLSKRVTKLESESFFRLVSGNVTLKEAYRNLWVPGWLAAGGVGSGGGSGGTMYLKELLDIYHDSSGILRGDGTAVNNGDVLIYDLTNDRWVAGAVSAAGTVTNYGDITTQRIATVGSVDIYNDVKWGSAGQTANTYTLTVNGVTKTVALEGYGGGGGGAYTLGTQTAASAAKGTMLGVNAISNDLSSTGSEASLIEWEPNAGGTGIGAWHFHGNLYSDGWIAAGGTGTPGGGGSGIDLAAMWASLTNSVADAYASTKINVAHIPNLTASMITDWQNVFTLRTAVSTTPANGTLLGVDALSNASSSSGGDMSRIEWNSDYNAWHVRGNLYADGWVAAGGVGSGGGGGASSLSDLTDVNDNLNPSTKNVLWYNSSSSVWDAHALTYSDISDLPAVGTTTGYLKYTYSGGSGSWSIADAGGGGSSTLAGLSDTTITSPDHGQVLQYLSGTWQNTYLYLGSGTTSSDLADVAISSSTRPSNGDVLTFDGSVGKWKAMASSGGGTVTSVGLTMPSCFSVSGTPVTSSGTLAVTFASQTKSYVLAAPTTMNGTPSFRALAALDIPDLSGLYVTLSTTQNNISGEKTFTTNPVHISSTSGIDVNASSYIDIGNARLVYDSSANALRVKNKSSGTMGLYADGFVAAGGVGSDSLVKFVQCTQSQYSGLTKDSSTIYYVTGTNPAKVYLGSIQLSN